MQQRWLQLRRVRILGARVYVHWSVFAIVLLLALVSLRSPVYAAISIASYLAVIVIHETGHAWVARRLGYEVDLIRIGFFHGVCEGEAPQHESEVVMIAWGGVLAQLASILGEHEISISEVVQEGAREEGRPVAVVVTTHMAREANMQKALARIDGLDSVMEKTRLLRIFE